MSNYYLDCCRHFYIKEWSDLGSKNTRNEFHGNTGGMTLLTKKSLLMPIILIVWLPQIYNVYNLQATAKKLVNHHLKIYKEVLKISRATPKNMINWRLKLMFIFSFFLRVSWLDYELFSIYSHSKGQLIAYKFNEFKYCRFGKLHDTREICFDFFVLSSWEPLKVENSWMLLLYICKKRKYEDM